MNTYFLVFIFVRIHRKLNSIYLWTKGLRANFLFVLVEFYDLFLSPCIMFVDIFVCVLICI